jgi:hypothetical protein
MKDTYLVEFQVTKKVYVMVEAKSEGQAVDFAYERKNVIDVHEINQNRHNVLNVCKGKDAEHEWEYLTKE